MALSVRAEEKPEPRLGGVLGSAVASAALFALPYVVPVLALISLVCAFPLIVQRLRRGLGSAVLATMLGAALVALVFTPVYSLKYLVLMVLPGMLIGEAMARGRGLLRGCGWAFAVVLVQISLQLLFDGPRLAEQALAPLEAVRSPAFLAELRTRLPQENVDLWKERATDLYRAMEVVYPAAFVILGALMVIANATLLRVYLAVKDPGWLEGGEFERLRWPLALAVLFVMAGGAVALKPLRAAGYNVLLIVAFFFVLQGVAVVAFYARRLAGPLLLRGTLLVLVLANPWAPYVLSLLGLFDTWADFRKWAEPPAAEQG
jgi:hypothetical protein